ncbi:hypothetical protein DB347_20785 [Opitutaceae bacterium EW11]|nr:hypothetical protein DB347_20785 [Opitutaceae bacterium EW11]
MKTLISILPRTKREVTAARAAAKQYRAEEPDLAGSGFVVVFDGQVCGWTRDLATPSARRPGCYAVGTDGTVHRAEGGDQQSGARQWVQVWPLKQTTSS